MNKCVLTRLCRLLWPALLALPILTSAGCGASAEASAARLEVVAAENEYGNVAGQVGGRYVRVISVESNPNTDPHSYEVSPGVAESVAGADLVIQNGLGYDGFMDKLESASPRSGRRVIDVQHLLGLPDRTPNPHLWYRPGTMSRVAVAVASDLSALRPAHAGYFTNNSHRFVTSLRPWLDALAQLRSDHAGAAVAATEPVADYMLEAAGLRNLTPFALQADVMNGVDPSPQVVALENGLLSRHEVRAFVYNLQVTDPLTQSFIGLADRAGVPVVGVYETMPVPGFDYQTWMLAEVRAVRKAITNHASTVRLR